MFSYSLKPKKEHNNEYLNISNNFEEDNTVLSIDLKTINFENIAVELALNVLQLNHNEYYNMNQTQIVQYYNDKMKLTKNMNYILALKIILKSKLKGLDVKINKMNGIMISDYEKSENAKYNLNEKMKISDTEEKINSLLNADNKEKYQIKQVQQNNFKIIQHNITPNINNNIMEYSSAQNLNNKISKPQIIYSEINTTKIPTQPTKPTQPTQPAQPTQPTQPAQTKSLIHLNNNYESEQKINNATVVSSSEFDIDSIINSYAQKKNQGFIK
jgi:hypothetical protein